MDDAGPIRFVDAEAAARYLALEAHTLECYQSLSGGPTSHKFGKYVRYRSTTSMRSGLGLEAQRTAVARFAEAEGITLHAEFTEVETGKGADALDRRPQLAAALATARQAKCPVLVAKLDRLSRDVAFIAGVGPFISALANLANP